MSFFANIMGAIYNTRKAAIDRLDAIEATPRETWDNDTWREYRMLAAAVDGGLS